MTETLETSASDAHPNPAPEPPQARVKRRPYFWWIILGMFAIMAAMFVVMFGQGTYNDQLSTVQKLESTASKYATTTPDAMLDAQPGIQAFKKDPLLQSQAWAAYRDEESKAGINGSPAPSDRSIMEKGASSVWWPGLSERAHAAAQEMHYSPDWYAYQALLNATSNVKASCREDTNLTVDQRIQKWVTDQEARYASVGSSFAGHPAERAVMPAAFRAGVPIFCNTAE